MTPHMAYNIWNLAINMQFMGISQVYFNCFIKILVTIIRGGHII